MKTHEKTIGSNEYTGRVYSDAGEQHHDSVDDYLHWLACEGDEPDDGLWTVAERRPKAPSAERLVCDALEESGYDTDLIDGIVSPLSPRLIALQATLDAWFADDSLMAYFPTRTRVVLSPEHIAELAAMKAEFAS